MVTAKTEERPVFLVMKNMEVTGFNDCMELVANESHQDWQSGFRPAAGCFPLTHTGMNVDGGTGLWWH